MGAPATAGNFGVTYMSRMWIARRDNNGYGIGTVADPASPTVDTVYSAYVLDNTVDLTLGDDAAPLIRFLGRQTQIASTFLPNVTLGIVGFNLSTYDETFNAQIESNAVDTSTSTAATVTAPNPTIGARPSWLAGFNVGVTNKDTGQDEWGTIVFLNNNIKKGAGPNPSLQTGDAQNPSNLAYNLTPDLSLRGADGQLLSAYSLSLDGNKTHYNMWRTAYPLHLATYIADGVETTFTLPYLPVNSDATGAGENMVTINGTSTAVSSISASTGLVTLSAAGTSGDIVQVLYQTNYVASS